MSDSAKMRKSVSQSYFGYDYVCLELDRTQEPIQGEGFYIFGDCVFVDVEHDADYLITINLVHEMKSSHFRTVRIGAIGIVADEVDSAIGIKDYIRLDEVKDMKLSVSVDEVNRTVTVTIAE